MDNATHTASISISSQTCGITVRELESGLEVEEHAIPEVRTIGNLLVYLGVNGWEICGPVLQSRPDRYYVALRRSTQSE